MCVNVCVAACVIDLYLCVCMHACVRAKIKRNQTILVKRKFEHEDCEIEKEHKRQDKHRRKEKEDIVGAILLNQKKKKERENNRHNKQYQKMDIDENAGQGTPPAQQPNGGGGGNDGGGGGGGGGGPADIEQFLLHQFSRMGTTDHDELVNQLQKVLGNQLNYNTARFFLDMNNWYVCLFTSDQFSSEFFVSLS